MANILFVTSSPRGASSHSNKVASELLGELRRNHPGSAVTVRDLVRDRLPHIDEDFVIATRSVEGPQTEPQRAAAARSDTLVDELLAADIIVVAAAMINFSIPSGLKSWIDHVCRSGRTFSYGESGPKGLVTGKKVFLVAARGGVYSGDKKSYDFQVPYVLQVLGFLGMTDVEVIDIEGTAFGPEAAERAVAAGLAAARWLAGEKRAA
jgi:FMN-dependent NADH-azoreductase